MAAQQRIAHEELCHDAGEIVGSGGDGSVVAGAPAGACRRGGPGKQGAVVSEAELATAPVEIDGVVLLRVRGVSSFSAKSGPPPSAERIVAVAADGTIPSSALRGVEDEAPSGSWAGDRLLMGVFEADARLEQVSRQNLAANHLKRIRQAIDDYRRERTPKPCNDG